MHLLMCICVSCKKLIIAYQYNKFDYTGKVPIHSLVFSINCTEIYELLSWNIHVQTHQGKIIFIIKIPVVISTPVSSHK
jgi:hypothetical protein